MTELFYAVLKAGFQGSIVILAVLLLRLVLKRAPRSVFCLLWLLAGLRLVLPFEIESNLSLQPQIQEPELTIQMEAPVQIPVFAVPEVDADVPEAAPAPVNPGNYEDVQNESFLYEINDGAVSPVTFADIAAPVWLLGMGIMAFWCLWSYLKLKRRVRTAYLIENGCFECPGLDTAFVLGFLPPKIYLPAGLTEGEKKFIFDHENTHIARGDHWFKLLGWLVLALHWFNPLVWVGYSLLCRDIELACDEHVVKSMSLSERKAYSAALLSCGGHTARIAACPVAFGESNPKKRILNVLNYKRPGFRISLAAVIAVIFVAVCLLTSPGKPSLLEFGNVADEELHFIGIGTKNGLADVSHPDDIRKIQKLLDSISWEKDTPTERGDESDGYVILFNSLLAEDALYFSEDCSLVWAEGTQAYPVSDGGKLREYLDSLTEAVWNRETSGEPFADISQPAQWLRGISESAVREARIYIEQPTVQEGNTSSTTRSMGILSARDFGALLDILNGLPESAIVSESTLRRQSFGTLVGSLTPHGGMTLTVYDDVNQLVMVLRLVKNDVVEFILIDELDKVGDEPLYLDHPKCWILEDDTLLAFLKEMQEYPLIITPIEFFGHDKSDAEETLPAWNMDMTEEEYLEKCRAALEEYQSQGTWAIQTENSFWGVGVLNDSSLSQWFGNGEDYYTWTRIDEDKGAALWFDLCVDGVAYHRSVYSVAGGTAEDWNTKWEEGSTDNRVIYPHWPLWYDWESADIEFVEQATTDSMESVTFTVQGCPFPEHPDRIDEYQVTFHFQEDVLFWIQLTYQRADALGGGKREYKLSAFTPADAENISKCHSEALLHIHGICNDPACTDENHDHSGVSCTDADCTNSAHHHDEDHH